MRALSRFDRHSGGMVVKLFRLIALLLPAVLLLIATWRAPRDHALLLLLGTLFQLGVCMLSFGSRQSWRQPLGPSVITLYVIALGWLWLGSANSQDWYGHLAKAILLLVPLSVFAHQMLNESGAAGLRRARLLADRLAARQDWPPDLVACKSLPEVKALREAVHGDATPALALLHHASPQVRIAALAALEFRQDWQRGQAELVMQLAQRAPEPPVRAAAIMALANVEDRHMVEVLAEMMRDPSWDVRKATTDALLWDSNHRWSWIRHAIRRCLADPTLKDDGPLRFEGQALPAEAVADLTAWAAEKGLLGLRAALTLGIHYSRVLSDRPDAAVVIELRDHLANQQAPSALRMELASLLRHTGELDRPLLEKLLDAANPAPLRLLAAESLLAEGEHANAVATLHELARLPNREIAVATADVVQRHLGVDLGLAPRQPLPPVHSRQAVDVQRRVMLWAAQQEQPCLRE